MLLYVLFFIYFGLPFVLAKCCYNKKNSSAAHPSGVFTRRHRFIYFACLTTPSDFNTIEIEIKSYHRRGWFCAVLAVPFTLEVICFLETGVRRRKFQKNKTALGGNERQHLVKTNGSNIFART